LNVTQNYSLQIEADTDQSAAHRIIQGLERFNRQYAPEDQYNRLVITMRDTHHEIMGGLVGGTYWGWLNVDYLWVSEDARGMGFGTRILHMAEEEARRRGCHSVHLDTLSFQALPFYQKHGYTVFGALEDHPLGHTRYFLKKKLDSIDFGQ
jgi:GNAT superfamily N-acetyltransferase